MICDCASAGGCGLCFALGVEISAILSMRKTSFCRPIRKRLLTCMLTDTGTGTGTGSGTSKGSLHLDIELIIVVIL